MQPAPLSPNRATYESAEYVGRYTRQEALLPAEEDIFRRYNDNFSGAVLDIAIGAGRTTKALLPRARRYLGLDLSRNMVEAARRHFENADLRVLDMRDVPKALAGQRFDAILISFNGLDYISWEDRCTLLKAIPGLLADGGVFVFSTHDLAAAREQRGLHLRADLQHSWDTAYRPRSLARLLLRAPPWLLKVLRNRRRLRRLEAQFEGYAYLNDEAEDYGLLTTYVSTPKQLEVLRAYGFSRVETEQPLLQSQPTYYNYFVCRA